MAAESLPKSRIPLFDGMNRIPGGLMLIPLILGSIVGTFAPPLRRRPSRPGTRRSGVEENG
ncbi:2-keto-3-deoxygluconate permease [Arthrobacter sp. MDT3-44]